MKLLFVTPKFPVPPKRGYTLMAYNHIRELSKRHTIDLVSFADSDASGECMPESLKEWCRNVILVPMPRWRALFNMIGGAFETVPFQVAYHRSAEMARAVADLVAGNAYDAVLFQLTRMAEYLPPGYDGAAVLSMVDPFVLNYQRSPAGRSSVRSALFAEEVKRLIAFERKQFSRFDRLLLISQPDILDYEKLLGEGKLGLVPHAVRLPESAPVPFERRRRGMIVMSGSLFYRPNIEAVDYFCSEIFPLVKDEYPSAELWLVGSKPSRRIRRWGRRAEIHVTGSVPDVHPFLAQAAVSVCPVRLAVGTQTKILDALAAGTPVVTTPEGNHGIGAADGRVVHVAPTPQVFANRVVSLLRGENWSAMSAAGRTFVRQYFTWEMSAAHLEHQLREAVAIARNRARSRAATQA